MARPFLSYWIKGGERRRRDIWTPENVEGRDLSSAAGASAAILSLFHIPTAWLGSEGGSRRECNRGRTQRGEGGEKLVSLSSRPQDALRQKWW